MADIELVIKIPEEVRVAITRMGLLRIPDEMQKKVDRAIQRGTPLPKGHGRLIDASELDECKEIMNTISGESKYAVRMDDIRNIDTIIEADKESEEGV